MRKKSIIILFSVIGTLIISSTILGFIYLPPLLDSLGPVPQFVENDWIDLQYISNISKYRSTIGHGYPNDDYPTSNKHYFNPYETYTNNNTIKVYSPVSTKIIKIEWEQHRLNDGTIRGQQVHLKSIEHPSITFIFFHINTQETGIYEGQELSAGEWVGYCDCRENCNTDIAIKHGRKIVSWFQLITDNLFAFYQGRGISNRSIMIKTDIEVQWSEDHGYSFSHSDPADWVNLY
ncbi:MAG: hypothetical protein ACFFC3_15430 [Candidatus Odinarchaeota archaeon]